MRLGKVRDRWGKLGKVGESWGKSGKVGKRSGESRTFRNDPKFLNLGLVRWCFFYSENQQNPVYLFKTIKVLLLFDFSIASMHDPDTIESSFILLAAEQVVMLFARKGDFRPDNNAPIDFVTSNS